MSSRPGRLPALPKYRVLFAMPVLQALCAWAERGYEARGKAERLGFLFGRIEQKKRVVVTQAVLYRGGRRTRSGAFFELGAMLARRRAIGRKLGLRPLGMFHSHVEQAGQAGHGFSEMDIETFEDDYGMVIEAVVSVRFAGRKPQRTSRKVLFGFEESTGYSYNIRVLGRSLSGARLLPVQALGAGRKARRGAGR